MRKCHLFYPLLLLVLTGLSSCEKKTKGCTDPSASNFSIHADEDDGSCVSDNAFEGNFLFSGNKFVSGGGSSFVEIPFVMEDLGDGKFKISGFEDCNNIRLRAQNSQMVLETSDCTINSWQFFISSFNMQLSFTKVLNGSTTANYSGSVTKE